MTKLRSSGAFLAFFAFLISSVSSIASKDSDLESGYLYVDEDSPGNIVEDFPPWNPDEKRPIHQRWKRETSSDLNSSFNWRNLPGAGYLRKLHKLSQESKNLPPPIKEAIKSGDFSNVTAADVHQVNITILEYIPPKMIAKMNSSVLEVVISRFLTSNRPNAMGRLVEAAGNKFSPAELIDKMRGSSSNSPQSNEAAGVLLHSAMSRLGDIGGITEMRVNQLKNDELLKYVPEEQLMKINDSNAAKLLLNTLYENSAANPEANEPDDKALVYKLIETQYGSPANWTEDTIRTVSSKYLQFLPAAALKQFSPEKIPNYIFNLRAGNFDNPLQAKTVADTYLIKSGFKKNEEGNLEGGNPKEMPSIFATLDKLAAFVNPSAVENTGLLSTIISSCDKWNLPAPLKAVTKYLKTQFKGKPVNSLTREELSSLTSETLKNSPPEVIGRAVEVQAVDDYKIKEIGKVDSGKSEGIFGNSFFNGLIAQLTPLVLQRVKQYGNKYDINSLPSGFIGGIGYKGIQEMDGRQVETFLQKIKENPGALEEGQKAFLLKRLREENMLDGNHIPPEYSYLRPRVRGSDINNKDLAGLPSDSELRLAHGQSQSKAITPLILEKDPHLVGTLTPKQVESIDIQQIPGVLAAVRQSKDGPQPQTLKALSKRFADYIRLKSDEYEDEDKKLLKYITAAEVSKVPASVLAYFVDRKQTAKLPAPVRKEILIALGELSAKDRALIPDRTREEIITQGLDALDSILDGDKRYGVAELAAIGQSVGDLPPNKIKRLTPVALEQALDMVQGTTEEDNGLKQRACLSPEQRKAWRAQIIENYGKSKSWDPATVTTLCCLLPLLDESDLMAIDKESIVTCHCISDAPAPSHLTDLKKSLDKACERKLGSPDETKKVFERVRAERAMDLNDLESQIITRRKRAHDHSHHKRSLSCFAVRLAGNSAEFDTATLETLRPKDIKNCLYDLGSVKLDHERERILWKHLVDANQGQVKNIPVDQLKQAGYILSGIQQNEVNDLDFANDDVVAAFGRPLGFSKTLLTKMAERIEKVRRKTEYQPEDLIIVRNILCGFDLQTLQRIVPEAFSLALPILRDLDAHCELTHLAALVNIATRDKVYGDPANWTSADVRGVGILLKGLAVSDIKKIPNEAFLGVTPTVAAALAENTLTELSPEQLSFIPKFSAQAMSNTQLESLSSEGRAVLQETMQGPLVSASPLHSLSTLFLLTAVFAKYFF